MKEGLGLLIYYLVLTFSSFELMSIRLFLYLYEFEGLLVNTNFHAGTG